MDEVKPNDTKSAVVVENNPDKPRITDTQIAWFEVQKIAQKYYFAGEIDYEGFIEECQLKFDILPKIDIPDCFIFT